MTAVAPNYLGTGSGGRDEVMSTRYYGYKLMHAPWDAEACLRPCVSVVWYHLAHSMCCVRTATRVSALLWAVDAMDCNVDALRGLLWEEGRAACCLDHSETCVLGSRWLGSSAACWCEFKAHVPHTGSF